jgi:hypothetical protein
MTHLIQCRDHRWAPWCVVCVHLCEGTATEWIAVPIEDEICEVQNEWPCPGCHAQMPYLDDKLLEAICIHCVAELKAGR